MAVWNTIKYTEIRPDRFDAEFFQPLFKDNIRMLSRGECVQLGNLFYIIDRGEKADYLDSGEIPVLRSVNIRDLSFNNQRQEYVTRDYYLKKTKGQVHKEDILITSTGTGTLGRTSIWYKEEPAFNVPENSFLRNPIGVNPYFVAAFLSTKYGVLQLFQNQRGSSGQLHLYPVDIRRIVVPKFLFDYQDEIGNTLVEAFNLEEQSKCLYHQAEALLAQELQLDKLKLSNKKWYSANYCEVVENGRYDGEYYQPKYLQIETHIKSYKKGYGLIKDFFCENKCISSLSEEKFKYIEIGDVNISDGTYTYNTIAKKDLPVSARIELANGDVLISTVRPYRGAVSIIYDSFSDLIGSSAFTVVREKKGYRKEVLMVLLRLDCYKELLMKWNVGTSYPVINNKDVMNLVIPMVPDELQSQISSLVQQSFSAKQKSKSLLAQAKYRVEELVEQESNKSK